MTELTQNDPFIIFDEWFEEAHQSEINDPNAMALATVGGDGAPSLRMVLLKAHDRDGFVFYTNLESHKGNQLAANQNVALLFHWKSLRRQIRIEGSVAPVSETEADSYYASRPYLSQIGAWASQQSRPLTSREQLESEITDFKTKYEEGQVPRPPHWSGFRVTPNQFEFWQDGAFRIHDRWQFNPNHDQSESSNWSKIRLYP